MKNIFKKSVKYISLFIAVFCISQAGGWTSVYASILYQQDVSDTFWDMNTHNSGNNLQGFPLGTGLTGSFDGQITIDLYLENQHTNGDVTYYWDLMKCDDSTYSYSSCISIAEFTTYVPTRYTKTLTSSTDNSVSEISFDSSKYYILKKSGNQFSDDRIYGNSIYSIYIKIQGAVPVDTSTRFISTNPLPSVESLLGNLTEGGDVVTGIGSANGLASGMQVQSDCVVASSFVGDLSQNDFRLVSNDKDSSATCSSGSYLMSFFSVKPFEDSEFSTTLYINENDYEDGMKLCMYFYNDGVETSGMLLDQWVGVAPDQCFDIQNFGESTFTSSLIQFAPFSGLSTVRFVITKPSSIPVIGFLFNNHAFLSKDVRFVIGQLSAWDNAVADGNLQELLLSNVGLSPIPACQIATFDLTQCLISLFIPTNTTDLLSVWCRFTEGKVVVDGKCGGTSDFNGVLNVFPLGYVTRIIDIFVNTGSVKPPPLSYTFSDTEKSSVSGTGLEGATLSYQIFDHLDVLESIETDKGDGKNIWDIIMPFFNVLVSLAVFLFILNEIMQGGFNLDTGDITDYAKNNVRFSKAELQKLNNPTIAKTEREYDLYKKL